MARRVRVNVVAAHQNIRYFASGRPYFSTKALELSMASWFSASQCSLRVRAMAWATPASAACEILIFKAFASESRSSGSDTFVARLGALRGRLTVSMTLSLFNSANMRTFHNTLYVHTSQARRMFLPNNFVIIFALN